MSPLFRVSAIRTTGIVCAMLACALLASCSKAAKQTLRLNLVPGNTYALSVRTSSDAVIAGPDGNNIPIAATSVNRFTLQAGEVDFRGDTFVSAQAGDTEFPFVFVPLAAIFKTYTFGIKLSPIGRISEFVNTETMREGIRGSLAALGSGTTIYGNTTPDAAIALISDDGLRSMIEPVTAIWPEAPVAPGDEWNGPDTYSPAFHTIASSRYRLKSWDDSEVKIHVEIEIRPAGDRARDPNRLHVGDTSGQGTGEIRVDPMLGTIRSYEVTQETSGSFKGTDGVEYKTTATSRIQAELTAR